MLAFSIPQPERAAQPYNDKSKKAPGDRFSPITDSGQSPSRLTVHLILIHPPQSRILILQESLF